MIPTIIILLEGGYMSDRRQYEGDVKCTNTQ